MRTFKNEISDAVSSYTIE